MLAARPAAAALAVARIKGVELFTEDYEGWFRCRALASLALTVLG